MVSISSSDFEDVPAFVDTEQGMVTPNAVLYHVREAEVRKYASDVLDVASLDRLIRWSDAWLASTRTFFVWMLLASLGTCLLFGTSVWIGAGLAFVATALWHVASPAFPSPTLAQGMTWADTPVAQGLAYVAVLSYWAGTGALTPVWIALGGFVLARWGIMERLFGVLLDPIREQIYPLSVPDQVLRGMIHRVALRHRRSAGHVDAVASDVMKRWTSSDDS